MIIVSYRGEVHCNFPLSYLGAAESNFDWSSAHGLVAGCSMRAELGIHISCACGSFSSNYWSGGCRICRTCSAAPAYLTRLTILHFCINNASKSPELNSLRSSKLIFSVVRSPQSAIHTTPLPLRKRSLPEHMQPTCT